MGLYGVGAVEAVARARAAGHGLVVLDAVVAEGDVVHRAGALGLDAERRVEGAGDGLGGLDVPGDRGGRVHRRQHRALGDADLQRLQAAAVERDVLGDQGAEDVQYGRHHHRAGRIGVARRLRRRTGEVQDRAAARAVDGDGDVDDGPGVGLVSVRAVPEGADDTAYGFLGVVLDGAP